MCGRFVSARKRLELLEEFGVERDRVAASPDPEPAPDYNVAPTKKIFAVLERPAREDEPQARELRVLRWGLVPSWAKEASIGSRMINARAETVAVKPAYRRAFAKRRCILPADGYYEWQAISDGGKKRKQPYFITERTGEPSPSPDSTSSGGTTRSPTITSAPGCGRPRLSRPRQPTMSARSTIACPW
jgi:Uncharacterized conserved protein